MFKNYKNSLYSNIIAIAGFPAIVLLIYMAYFYCKTAGTDIIVFILFPISLIYCSCIILLSIIVLLIEKICLKKFNKQIPIYKISNNLFYKIYLYVGLFLFLLLLIPTLLILIWYLYLEINSMIY